MSGFLLTLALIGVYFIPTFVGWNKKNVNAIILLNIFLGWTFIGWVVALVWAVTKD
nr:superinfection immunity protein [uncultured Marinifilum sp.]